MRIGIVRESMLTFPGVKADEPITQAAAKEIKAILGDYLGATLVESVDPLWPGDPSMENMNPSYTRALAQLVPVFFPDILYRLRSRRPAAIPRVRRENQADGVCARQNIWIRHDEAHRLLARFGRRTSAHSQESEYSRD